MNEKIGSWSRVTIENGIALVTISREERMNALHPPAHYELADTLDALATDPSVQVVIMTGQGSKAFCAGHDMKVGAESGDIDIGPNGFAGISLRDSYPLPIIAAVNGVAFGGGFEAALACDLIIAAESARFALPEPKVGLAAVGGGIQRLARTIGLKRALGMILTSRTVSADEGMALGFVNQVVPDNQLLNAAFQWAQQITECAPLAIRCSKQVAYISTEQATMKDALNLENYPLAAALFNSEDMLEGQRAFIEKRKPQWRGK